MINTRRDSSSSFPSSPRSAVTPGPSRTTSSSGVFGRRVARGSRRLLARSARFPASASARVALRAQQCRLFFHRPLGRVPS